MPSQTIAGWIDRGRLVRVHHGVYAVGLPNQTAWARACAAVLACGDDSALSRAASLALWELGTWPHTMEVTAPTLRTRPGIRTYRSETLEGDVRRHQGIRTTSVVRTILDLQPRCSDRRLTRLVNDARRAKRLPAAQLADLLARCTRIAALIDPGQRPTRSGFEDDFLAFCAHHGLPAPLTNPIVAGVEVDALFADHRLIVEVDGWPYHRGRDSFTTDRERDQRTAAAGYLTFRIPDGGLDEPAGAVTAQRLRDTLARRG